MNSCSWAVRHIAMAFCLIGATANAESERLAKIVVNAGEYDRLDVPVMAHLDGGDDPFDTLRPMRLVERVGDDLRPVPYQLDPASPRTIWWILRSETKAGASRNFELLDAFPEPAPGVEVTADDASVEIRSGSKSVLKYNHAFVLPPPGAKPAFVRNAYIHPLYSPSGKVVTEDFPADHLHHKGVWFPWTRTRFEGREIDFWNLGEELGTVQFAGFVGLSSGPVFGGFIARHEHVDLTQPGGKVALNETWDVRVWNVGGAEAGYWLWDLTSVQNCATDSILFLPQYRYGGLGFRGAKGWIDENYEALASTGKTHKNGHLTKAKWIDHSGHGDGWPEDEWAGVAILDHPENFRHPQSMRLWDSGGAFFCYSPIQEGDAEIRPGEAYTSRYRFYVHEGRVDKGEVERLWRDFADPPVVRVEYDR